MRSARERAAARVVWAAAALVALTSVVWWPETVEAGRGRGRERTSPRTSATAIPIDSGAVGRMRAELGPEFRVKHSRNYRIAYDTSPHVAEFHTRLFEAVHDAFRDFFASSGFQLRRLERHLEAVMFDDRADFTRHARKLDPALEGAGGFYSTRENRIVLFDSFTDASYRRLSDQIEASERNVAEVRRQLSAGKRGRRVTLSYSDGRSRTMSRKQALAHVRAKQRELRGRRRELESHFADRNLTTTIHECVHQLSYNLGVQSLAADNPKWLGEGLATYFETVGYRDTGPDGRRNPERFKAWRTAYDAGRLIPLTKLLVDDGLFDVSRPSASTAYGQSWALMHYMLEERAEQLFGYLRRVAASRRTSGDPSAARLAMFREAFGEDVAAFERHWLRYMSRL